MLPKLAKAIGTLAVTVGLNWYCQQAQCGYVLQRLIGTDAIIPAGTGTFTAFDEVALDGQHVALRARGANQKGIYLWNGVAFSKVADLATVAPGGAGTFADFHSISLDDGSVAFTADGTTGSGVYTTLGGALRRVADQSTPMPASSALFSQFTSVGGVAIDHDEVVFSGFGSAGASSNQGVYREKDGALSRIADRGTQIPDSTNSFLFFSTVDASQGQVLFSGGRGSGGDNGFYSTLGAGSGQVRSVLKADTQVPGLQNPISIFSPNPIQIDGTRVAFAASDSASHRGIYIEDGGLLASIADTSTIDPYTGSPFASFGAYSMDGGEVAFIANSGGPNALYVSGNGGLHDVVHVNDILDGKTITTLGLFGRSFASQQVAFRAAFNDGSSAIYIAQPNPSAGYASITLQPLFDANVVDGVLGEGDSRIDVLNDARPLGNKRAVMEFDLSGVPVGSVIAAATLELDVTLLTHDGPAWPELAVYGYSGDGVLDEADAARTDIEVGQSGAVTDLGKLELVLNADAIRQLFDTGGTLGIVGLAKDEFEIGFRALEDSLGSAARLDLTYAPFLPADFNEDNHVDDADFSIWTANFGASQTTKSAGDADGDRDVDGDDFLNWQRQYLPATTDVASVAEPTTLAPMAVLLTVYVIMTRSLRCRGQRGALGWPDWAVERL